METRVGILLVAEDLASGNISKVEQDLRGLGPAGAVASGGIGGLSRALHGAGGAVSHFKGAVGGLLTGPLGFLGLGTAALGVGGFLKASISNLDSWAAATEKLTSVTGESATKMSGYLALTDRFGIAADRATQIAGFEEKAIGLLSTTQASLVVGQKSANLVRLEGIKLQEQETGAKTKLIDKLITEQKARDALSMSMGSNVGASNKLIQLQQEFGVSLTDAKGAALPFTQVLSNVSDYYASNASQADKAALASKLFGRGYIELVPILKLGAKGIADAEAAAAKLGLTLTDQNANELAQYQQKMRDLGDATKGLQLQIGLALVPALSDLASAATGFLADNNGSIVAFVQQLIDAGRTAAGFITSVLIPAFQSIAGAALGLWNAIPGPIRELLVGTYVANRVVKFLFGFDVVGSAEAVLGQLFKRALLGAVSSAATAVVGQGAGGAIAHALAQNVFIVGLSPLAQEQMHGGGLNIPGGPAAAGAGGAEAAAGAGGGGGLAELFSTATGGAGLSAAMGILAPLAMVAIAPLAAVWIAENTGLSPQQAAANDLASRQATAAARGLNPANVPTTRGAPLSAAPYSPGSYSPGANGLLGPPAPISNETGLITNASALSANTQALMAVHAGLVMEFGAHAGTVVSSAKHQSDAAFVAKIGDLVTLFKTSDSPSQKSIDSWVAKLAGYAADGDKNTRAALTADLKALQAISGTGVGYAKLSADQLSAIKDQGPPKVNVTVSLSVTATDVGNTAAVVQAYGNPKYNQVVRRATGV